MPIDAWRGEADLADAVVVERSALDHRVDRVAVLDRIAQPTQHDDAEAVAEHRAGGIAVERAAMSVRREDRAFLVQIAAALRQLDRNAAGERHVALIRLQALYRGAHRDERGRARVLDVERGPLEIELVRNARRDVVVRVAHQNGQWAERIGDVAPREEVLQVVAVRRCAGEYADRSGEALRVVAGVLDRLPCRFEEQPLLRIEDFGFLRREAEEFLVELVGIGEHAARTHVVRVRAREHVLAMRGLELLGREARDAFAPREQVAP